jgi:hypothetical protein
MVNLIDKGNTAERQGRKAKGLRSALNEHGYGSLADEPGLFVSLCGSSYK